MLLQRYVEYTKLHCAIHFLKLFFQLSVQILKTLNIQLLAISIDFSIRRGPFTSTFSLPQISNQFFNAYFSVSCFSGFYTFSPKATFIQLEDFYFLVDRVIFGTPKSEATSLWNMPFSGSLGAFNEVIPLGVRSSI